MRSMKQELLALLREGRKKFLLIFPLFSEVKKKYIMVLDIRPTERENSVCARVCVLIYLRES